MRKRNSRAPLLIITYLLWELGPFSGITALCQDAPLTLEQCIDIALSENPVVKSLQDQIQASLARVNQAKALSQPSLDIDADLQPNPFEVWNSGESYVGVSKSFLFPGKRKVNTAIATHASNEVSMDSEVLKVNLIYQVKMAFYTMILNEEHLKYAQQNKDLAQDFLDKTRVMYEAGEVPQVEVIRAQVEVAKAVNEIEISTNELKSSRADLLFLMGNDKNSELRITGELYEPPVQLDLEYLKDRALLNRVEIKKMRISMEKELLVKKQAKLTYLPDFDLGFSRHTIIGESKTYDMTLALPIPLFFTQPVRGGIAEAEANYSSYENELKNIQNSIILEVDNAYHLAITAQTMIDLFDKEMLQQTEQVYQMLLFSYQEGEISGIDLIEARKTLINTRQSYGDALFNYVIAVASLERSIGQSLEME